jgi:hypothetical protein
MNNQNKVKETVPARHVFFFLATRDKTICTISFLRNKRMYVYVPLGHALYFVGQFIIIKVRWHAVLGASWQ